MMIKSVILFLIFLVCCDCKGYNRDDPENIFRVDKFNKIWYKARLRLKGEKLTNFRDALFNLEKQTAHMKETGLHSLDNYKNSIEGKLADLMKDYALQDVFSALYGRDDADKSVGSKPFKSKKVQQLWEKAKLSGYTDEQLEYMKHDFIHQDETSQKLKLAKEKYMGHETNEVLPKSDLNVEQFSDLKSSHDSALRTNHLPKTSAQILSDLEDELKKGYARLQEYSKPKSKEFVDPIVQSLWASAVASNLSQRDLASIQVDLMTLEKHRMRLRVLEIQLKKTNEKMSGHKENTEELHESIHKQLRKIEKLESFIENRIMTLQHTEL